MCRYNKHQCEHGAAYSNTSSINTGYVNNLICALSCDFIKRFVDFFSLFRNWWCSLFQCELFSSIVDDKFIKISLSYLSNCFNQIRNELYIWKMRDNVCIMITDYRCEIKFSHVHRIYVSSVFRHVKLTINIDFMSCKSKF